MTLDQSQEALLDFWLQRQETGGDSGRLAIMVRDLKAEVDRLRKGAANEKASFVRVFDANGRQAERIATLTALVHNTMGINDGGVLVLDCFHCEAEVGPKGTVIHHNCEAHEAVGDE